MRRGTGPEFELPFAGLADDAFYGVAGDYAKACAPRTEACPVAILAQLLTIAGVYVGRGPYFLVNETRHYPNEFLATIGATSTSRKGTSLGMARAPMARVDKEWMSHQAGGMSTSEGLINSIRDASEPRRKWVKVKGQSDPVERLVIDDPGVDDKRVLFIQSEFSTPLALMRRDGSTLDDTLKDLWDSVEQLRSKPKVNPLIASNPHGGIIAHSTTEALREHLPRLAEYDGFANRFTFLLVTRAGVLPVADPIPSRIIDTAAQRLREAVVFAKGLGSYRYEFSPVALEAWERVYPILSGPRPAVLGRSEGHVLRWAEIYALLDCSRRIELVHLRAALALWEYSERSVGFIFGRGTGSDDADKIVAKLREKPEGSSLTRSEIASTAFGKHIKKSRLNSALSLLTGLGLVTFTKEQTGGAPRLLYRAADANAQGSVSRYLPLIADLRQGPMKLEVPKLPLHRNGSGADEEFLKGSTQVEIINARKKEGEVHQ